MHTYYVRPLTYRGDRGFRVGERGRQGGWPISIWTRSREGAEIIRDAYKAARDGFITHEERDWYTDYVLLQLDSLRPRSDDELGGLD